MKVYPINLAYDTNLMRKYIAQSLAHTCAYRVAVLPSTCKCWAQRWGHTADYKKHKDRQHTKQIYRTASKKLRHKIPRTASTSLDIRYLELLVQA